MRSNVLVSSAGRRVELVQAFKESLAHRYPDSKVFCSDIDPHLSPACHISDGYFQVPRATDEGYIGSVLSLCKNNDIGLVIPTIDTELLVFSQNRTVFYDAGISLLISDEGLIGQCRDKRKTSDLFNSLEIEQPAILDKKNLVFPCFCKPYDGSCSIGAMVISSESDLTDEIMENPKNMFMELVPSFFSEYTVDAYYTSGGILKCLVPRKRIEVRAGEVSKGITKKNFVYEYLLKRVGKVEGARGCITFQFFVDEKTCSIKGLEINPRFGGGYPLSNDAGALFADWLIAEYLEKKEIGFCDTWKADLLMLRYDAKVLIHDGL